MKKAPCGAILNSSLRKNMDILALDSDVVKAGAMLATFMKAGGIHNMPGSAREIWLAIPLQKRMEAIRAYGRAIAGEIAGEEIYAE
jgi:hypothetical protein